MSPSENTYSSLQKKPGKAKAFFVCLAIASFLWLIHSLNTVYNYTLKVPVVFKNLPASKRPLSGLPNELSVDVKTSGLRLCLILLGRPFTPVEVDFNNLSAVNKNQNYILSSSGLNFKNSFGFETQIKHLRPDTLYFSEKTGLQKTVAVKVPLRVKCREGFGYLPPVIDPAFTNIWGDTALINEVDTIYTQPLNLTDVDQDISVTAAIIKPGKDIYTFINEVKVTVEAERLVEHSIRLPLSDLARYSGKRPAIFPSTVKVRFTCIQNTYSVSDSSQFRAMINSEKINPLTKKCPVFLTSAPPYVTIMSIEPREAEFLILTTK